MLKVKYNEVGIIPIFYFQLQAIKIAITFYN